MVNITVRTLGHAKDILTEKLARLYIEERNTIDTITLCDIDHDIQMNTAMLMDCVTLLDMMENETLAVNITIPDNAVIWDKSTSKT